MAEKVSKIESGAAVKKQVPLEITDEQSHQAACGIAQFAAQLYVQKKMDSNSSGGSSGFQVTSSFEDEQRQASNVAIIGAQAYLTARRVLKESK